ncbi:hypothetical protein [Lentzea sp.]|nr:hypothetical protein [Lentzea sp.]HUQ60245.1 hypothetical protein [Lentzea sp.]
MGDIRCSATGDGVVLGVVFVALRKVGAVGGGAGAGGTTAEAVLLF